MICYKAFRTTQTRDDDGLKAVTTKLERSRQTAEIFTGRIKVTGDGLNVQKVGVSRMTLRRLP